MFRTLFILLSIFFAPLLPAADGDVWFIQQDFYSFGKRDVYETLKKVWLQQLTDLSKTRNVPPILTIQAKGNPEYIMLVPVGSLCTMADFFDINKTLEKKVGMDVWRKQQEAQNSTINFQILSLHRFLPDCSCLAKETNVSLMNRPHVHYFLYSLEPGNGDSFEQLLQRKAKQHLEKKDGVCWRVWKVLFGADVPKYVVAVFSRTEDELAKDVDKLDIVDASIDQVIRRERDGKGILRRDLSYLPSQAPSGNGQS